MTVSRRGFLRGLGACVALPMLELTHAHAGGGNPQRLIQFFGPNGVPPTMWYPNDVGPTYTLTPCLQPLAPVRDDVVVLTGLDNVPGAPVHTYRTRSLFAERLEDGPYGPRFGRTLDQVVAEQLAVPGAIQSLMLTSEGATACGTLECARLYAISWAGEHDPASRLVHPRALFERLFGDPGDNTEAARARRDRRSQSVLDAVRADADALQRELGREDAARLDRYFTGIRELELRLAAPPPAPGTCSNGPVLGDSLEVDDLVDEMLDLMVLALSCDRTRVLSYMIGAAESYRPLSFLGLASDHHTASHFFPVPHAEVTTWQVGKYAALVSRLAAEVQPDGRRLLDDTLVIYASGMSDAVAHSPENLPILLAGRGLSGEHRALPAMPFANLCLAVAQSFGVETTTFGLDGTTPATPL